MKKPKTSFDLTANKEEKYTANHLVSATKEARERTGKLIATRVKMGRLQVVEIEYDDNGNSTETPLTEYINGRKAIDVLESLGK